MLIPTRNSSSLRMLRAKRNLLVAKRGALFAIALALSLLAHSLAAQITPESVPPPQPSAAVTLGDRTLFTINTPIGSTTAKARAVGVSARLEQVMRDHSRKPEDIHTVENPGVTQILSDDLLIVNVTDADAAAHSTSRFLLAETQLRIIREAIPKVRNEYSTRSITLDTLYALLATIALVSLLLIFRRIIFPTLYSLIERWRGTRIHGIKVQKLELLSEDRLVGLLHSLLLLIRFLLTALLLYFYFPLVFSFFPWTRAYGRILFGYILSPIRTGWAAFIHYLPQLLVVLVIAFFAWLALRLARFLFRELSRGTLSFTGFYPEWAMPTLKIVQVLIIVFAVVVAFPYLPGSESPAFKGVSIFLGILLSLGSSSAVSNMVAGVVLTYTRAFNIGDLVQISDTTGQVTEKTLLATQIRTIKNVFVAVPNSLVLNSHVVNFSRSPKNQPLILHVTIGIGYETPWRQVHTLLIAAASSTTGVLSDPAPFVLQTSLEDFCADYQINAYTKEPFRMSAIYSELNQNIQDEFNKAGIEIMTPHYSALRDGNTAAIPSAFLPPNYQPDSFRVSSSNPAQALPTSPPKTS
ncbi:mechanosensitive ion channel-like protein [Edaphobacter aggregans]|uniref:Mechanosensitive ion channel-like protein n=1 Tax=Edaphobacter aggregans TaxID=570835 RepID=A0A3R9QHS3_9BACT|nr:mechanosensitive ion channel family protein [Edaphobacter aggregans]RSL16882.1 mechanosensitive ion channel-like protein [Edaphobacter aggregans]